MPGVAQLFIGSMMMVSGLQGEPKQTLKQKLETYKEKLDLSQKGKEFKKKLKEKFKLGAQLDLDQDEGLYLMALVEGIDQGLLEAINEAADLLGVSHIDCLKEALLWHVKPFYVESASEGVPCGFYIDETGVECDDGIDESALNALPFYSLPIHQWEKKVIEKIVSSMAEKNLAQLLLDRKEMEKKGDQIHHVHPLRFMGCVMCDAYLKSCMQQFRNNSFKWSNFISGYADRMREEAAKNNLVYHVDGFCDFLKIEPAGVLSYIEKGDYEGFVLYLLQL